LEEGEPVFWRASPEKGSFIQSNWVLHALGLALLLLSLGFLLACISALGKGRFAEALIFFLMFLPWAVASLYLGYGRGHIFSRIARNSQYILTDRRIIIRTRLFRTRLIVAQLDLIGSVKTREIKVGRSGSIGEVIIRVGSQGLRITKGKGASRNEISNEPLRGGFRDLVLFGVRSPEEIASMLNAAANAARQRPVRATERPP